MVKTLIGLGTKIHYSSEKKELNSLSAIADSWGSRSEWSGAYGKIFEFIDFMILLVPFSPFYMFLIFLRFLWLPIGFCLDLFKKPRPEPESNVGFCQAEMHGKLDGT